MRGKEGRRERGEETGRVYKMEGGGNKRKEGRWKGRGIEKQGEGRGEREGDSHWCSLMLVS